MNNLLQQLKTHAGGTPLRFIAEQVVLWEGAQDDAG
jgi:hypothetical protein